MNDLKKCPCCGGDAEYRIKPILNSNDFDDVSVSAYCTSCYVQTKAIKVEHDSATIKLSNVLETAARIAWEWNRREGMGVEA